LRSSSTRAEGPDPSSSAFPISVGIEIIPRVGSNAAKASIYRYLPATVSYLEKGQNAGLSKQARIAGQGVIDEEGKKRIEFLASGPNNEQSSVAGWRDEYRLNYLSDEMQLRFGDQDYGLSYLTDYNRYGRGFGVDLAGTGEMKYGAYYQTSRWQVPDTSTSGAYVSRRLSDSLTMKLNMLQRNQGSSDSVSGYDDNIWSVETDMRPSKSSKLQFEYGKSSTDRTGFNNDSAYRFEFTGGLGDNTTYSVRNTHAGSDYRGYYRDTDLNRASVVSLIGDKLQTSLSYSEWKQNLKADLSRGTAPTEKLLQAGLRFPFKNNLSLSIGYDNLQRRDRSENSSFDFKSDAARLGISKSWDNMSFRAEVLSSNEADLLKHQSDQTMNYRLFATYRPDSKQFFTVYGGFGNSSALDGSRLLGGKEFGFSAFFHPSNGLTVRAWYTGDTLFGDRPDTDRGELRLTYKSEELSTWDLVLRQTNILAEHHPVTSYELLYSIPIDIPVGIRSDVGLISGRLFDENKTGSPGIAGALVTAGDSAVVTDSDGKFTLAALHPGTYSLTVDRKSVGLDRTTNRKLPIQVEVKGGKTSAIDLGVVEAASLNGQISVAAQAQEPTAASGMSTSSNPLFVDNSVLKTGGPRVEGILVELSDGSEVLRRLTDTKGSFLFESLRPGKWSMKVYEHNLPPYHYFDITSKDIDLSSGHQEKVDIHILRKLRQIKMVDDDSAVVTTVEPTDRK